MKRDLAIRALRMPPGARQAMRRLAGSGPAITTAGRHLPQRPRPPILVAFAAGLDPMAPSMAYDQQILRDRGRRAADERQGQLLRHRRRFMSEKQSTGLFSDPPHRLQHPQGQADLTQVLRHAPPSRNSHPPIHQRLLQPRRRHSPSGGKSPWPSNARWPEQALGAAQRRGKVRLWPRWVKRLGNAASTAVVRARRGSPKRTTCAKAFHSEICPAGWIGDPCRPRMWRNVAARLAPSPCCAMRATGR